jgi:CRISPR-associated endonuclease/helicase Cas3
MHPAMGRLWAKSDTGDGAGGPPRPHLLLGHMLDSAEVAGVLWDSYLSESVRHLIRSVAGGSDTDARQLVRFLAGIHDLGKASPAFQIKNADLASALREVTGEELCRPDPAASTWHHTLAGGAAIAQLLAGTAWEDNIGWIRAVIGGHHGVYPNRGDYRVRYDVRAAHGQGDWEQWRHATLLWLLRQLQIVPPSGTLTDLPGWLAAPSPATQVLLEGIVIESDWIASNGEVMPGIWDLGQISVESSRQRALDAVARLRFSPGWTLPALDDVFAARFGFPPRPLQREIQTAIAAMDQPGLVIVEAPMGEGKTEAALLAAEMLARSYGAHGVFVGLPTQATTDAMFSRVTPWLAQVQPGAALALSHGKSVVNAEYAALSPWRSGEVGLDCGCDVYSPSEWFTGRKRLLLSPHVVGTIDNILIAGAQVRHIALHHLGFAQKVVILDEVHACDIYMSQFLERALRWLGASQVPVVLLSATLPTSIRRRLIAAYTGQDREVADHYPQITVANANATAIYTPPATATKTVAIEILDEPGLGGPSSADADVAVGLLLDDRLADGGTALIIRNTVRRAQNLYAHLREKFPNTSVLLLHSRFTAADRAGHTDDLLAKLGDTSKGAVRPPRLIVVATQVAEQSLDIDADLLITDLAPVDLVLQRAGRLHRHTTNDPLRPPRLRAPTVVVTRMREEAPAAADPRMGLPQRPPGFVYPTALLARTAQFLYRTATFTLPVDVPAAIAEVYDDDRHRCDNPIWADALNGWDGERGMEDRTLEIAAINAALPPPGDAVDGLNDREQDAERVMVRAGDMPLEIALLRTGSDGQLHGIGTEVTFAPDGTPVGPLSPAEVGARAIGSTIRISNQRLIGALLDQPPLPGWEHHPWLARLGALILNEDGATTVEASDGTEIHISYNSEVGLTSSG